MLALCEDYQTKGFDTKEKTYGFFKRLLYYWDIPTSSKIMPFLVILNNVNYYKTFTWQSVSLTAF